MIKKYFFLPVLILALTSCAGRFQQHKKAEPEKVKVSFKARDYFLKGVMLQMEERYSDALVQFHKAELFDTSSASIYNALGENYLKLNELEPALHHLKRARRIDPQNTETWRLLGEVYFRMNDDAHAMEAYEKVFSLDPYDEQARNFLFFLYEKNKLPTKKTALYKKLLHLYGRDKTVLRKIADIYTRQRDFKNALFYLGQLARTDSTDAEIYSFRAQLYDAIGKSDSAIISLKHALRLQPENKDFRSRLALLYRKNRRYKDIIALYRPLLHKDSADFVARMSLAESYYFSDAYDSVKALLVPLVRDSISTWGVYDMLGRIALDEKDYADAVRYFRKVTELEPQNRFGWLFLGLTYSNRDDAAGAESIFRKGVEHLPKDGSLWSWLGVVLHQQEKYNEAVSPLENALKYDPTNLNALSTLPVVYQNLGNMSKSDSVAEIGISRLPDNALLLNNYAYSLSERGLQLERALHMAQKALSKAPENTSYLDTMGWIYYKMGNYDQAAHYVSRAIELGTDSPVVFEHMGDIYLRMNKPDQARIHYQKALELDPDNQQLKEKLARAH